MRFDLGMPPPAAHGRVESGAEAGDFDDVHRTSALGSIDEVALKLHLARIEGRDQERSRDALQGGLKGRSLL
jgi:hypothetical protein